MQQSEITVAQLATELRRLAQGVVRDIGRESNLACVSHLTALKALSQLMLEVLSDGVSITREAPSPEPSRTFPVGFCANSTARSQA